MKRKLFLLGLFIFLFQSSFGQPLSSYQFSAFSGTYTSVSGSFISASGGTGWGSTPYDDCWYNSIPIGFNFVYCGNTYTSLSASQNCWVVLGQTFSGTTYNTYDCDLSNSIVSGFGAFNLPRPILAALWVDVLVTANNVRYATTGSAPNRVFTIEWSNCGLYPSSTAAESVEIILYETTNQIDFAYSNVGSGSSGTGNLAIGITDGSSAYPVTGAVNYWSLNSTGSSPTPSMTTDYRSLTGLPATNQVYRWSPQCTGTPSAGTITPSIDSGCASYTTTLALHGFSTTQGITFQWQTSSTGTSGWTNISGATDSTYSTTVMANTWFRCVVTCTYSGLSATSPALECYLFSPPAGITGITSICAGATTTLSDATAGGTWSVGSSIVATVGSLTGVITGVSPGTALISYTTPRGACRSMLTVTVLTTPAPIAGSAFVCNGGTTTLLEITPGVTWSSSNPGVATVSSTGVVTGVSTGSVTITCTLGTCFAVRTLTVYPSPAAITGITSFCMGSSTALADATPGGAWSSSFTGIATVGSTGIVSGVSPGVVTISYTLPTTCGATVRVTVNPSPGAISGLHNVCAGQTIALFEPPGPGTWTSSNPFAATVGSTSGVVTGIAAGTATISYSFATGCSAIFTVTVDPSPLPITGSALVCVGGTDTLRDATPGGFWTVSSTTTAYIDPGSGAITGYSSGTDVVTYSLPSGCYTTVVATVSPGPGAIAGTTSVCLGGTTVLFGAGGGTWSSSNPSVATIDPTTGVVNGLAVGTTVISYTLLSGCASTATVVVNPNPLAITGSPTTCVGLTTTLTDASTGGRWTSSNTAIATVGSTTGLVRGIAGGVVNVTYTLPTGCYSTMSFTVNTSPGPILGTLRVCPGGSTTLVNTVGGGTWSSSTPIVAAIGATTGIVNGLAAGTTVISYSLGAGCATTAVLTVNPSPGPISGPPTVCAGNSITLTDGGGGTWSSSTPATAAIGATTGIVTGITSGVVTITYTLPTGCSVTRTETVLPLPAPPSGPTSVCQGATITLIDITPGGTWSSGNPAIATVSGTGMVTGMSAGVAVISYTAVTGCSSQVAVTVNALPTPCIVTGGGSYCAGSTGRHVGLSCSSAGITYQLMNGGSPVGSPLSGTGAALDFGVQTAAGTYTVVATNAITGCSNTMSGSATISINPLPAPIVGPSAVCVGSTITLADATGGGAWTSGTPSVATITGVTGIVSGITNGTTTITYTLPTACATTMVVTVSPVPGPILGPSAACVGIATATLTDAIGGGLWTSASPGVASIGSSSGIVSGVTPGTSLITYSLGTGCTVTKTITINPSPSLISGASAICVGTSTTYTDLTPGGVWASTAPSVATVGSASGIVNGITAGVATIDYIGSNGCFASKAITVNPLPLPVSGTMRVCVGNNTTLSDPVAGGSWSSGSPTIATVGASSGVVAGIAAGAVTITYSLGTGCTITAVVTVNPNPAAITGSLHACAGSTTSLSDATGGGVWSTLNPATGSVSATGVVSAFVPGLDTIIYTLPSTGCLTQAVVSVNPLPGAVTGILNLCTGQTSTLSSSPGGGLWTSSSSTIATVGSSSGLVTAVSFGTVAISYTFGGCSSTTTVTVSTGPSPIAGPANVCIGSTITLSDASPRGTWSSSGPSIAPISSSGVVSGIATGTVIISYTFGSTGCFAVMPVVVNAATVITGTPVVCTGQTTHLTDTSLGGVWSSGSPSLGTVDAAGTVTGLGMGVVLISYSRLGCVSTMPVTINPSPAGITGSLFACTGQTSSLSSLSSGGTWASSLPAVATINSAGIVSAIAPGMSSITYTLPSTGCYTTATFTVNNVPTPIVGPTAVCRLTSASYTAGGIGTWTSSAPSVATIGPATGVVFGAALGTAVITYSISTGCTSTKTISVVPPPLASTGPDSVCVGDVITLSNATPGGTWSASPTSVAVAGSAGDVTGIAAGVASVVYSIGSGCSAPPFIVTVNALPAAIVPSFANLCIGDTLRLHDATLGGTWNSGSPATATVDAGGMVTAASAGATIIDYTLPRSGCAVSIPVAVNAGPAPITGSPIVCVGSTANLSSATTGGTWTSSNASVATVTAGGVVRGITAGAVIISYTVPGFICPAILRMIVNPSPTSITGSPNICQGSTVTLVDATLGGVWSSSAPAIVAIGSTTGVMIASVSGATSPVPVVITYSTGPAGAGCDATFAVNVNPLPLPISGPTSLCSGQTILLTDASTGGVWRSDSVRIATISTSGVVTGLTGGMSRISYTNSYGCAATQVITVNPTPTISGSTNVCLGSTSALSGIPAGGSWLSLNPGVATVGSTGLVSGVALGSAIIQYRLSTGCATTITMHVFPLPTVYSVTGGGSHCPADTGVHIGLSGSAVGVDYMLYNGSTGMGSFHGTGTTLDFGLLTVAGTYTVIGTATASGCSVAMSGSAAVLVLPSVTPIVTLNISPNDSVCAGSLTTFTPTPYSGGSAPAYRWLVNGIPVSTAGTYSFIPTDRDSVTVEMTSNALCPLPTVVSTSQVMTVLPYARPSAGIVVLPGDTVCAGDVVNVVAGVSFGGPSPAYAWVKNTYVQPGETRPSYRFVPHEGDSVWCVVTSDYMCRLASEDTSNMIVLHVVNPPTAIVAITGNAVIAKGATDTLGASMSGAVFPTYQWYINGVAVAGATNAVFIHSNFAYPGADSVSCEIVSHGICTIEGHQWVYIQSFATAVQTVTAGGDIAVLPNPNKGAFVIKGSVGSISDEEVSVELTDIIGQTVYSNRVIAKNGLLNEHMQLSRTLANGMYMLTVRSAGMSRVFHVAVEQ